MREFLCSNAGASALVILVGRRPFGDGMELADDVTRWFIAGHGRRVGAVFSRSSLVAGLPNLRLSTDCPSPSRDSYQSFVLA